MNASKISDKSEESKENEVVADEESLSREVDDDCDHSNDSIEEKEDDTRIESYNESYSNLITFQNKLTLLSSLKVSSSGTGSWPASPQLRSLKGRKSNKSSKSLKGSPLCMVNSMEERAERPSPPSM